MDGERLSYRTLDVEQIGSVYEAVMGFSLEVAQGRSIAIKPTKSHGAPATINLEALLATKPANRVKWLAEQTDQKFTGQAADALKKAESLEDLLAALEKKIARYVTPNVVPKGAMVLQPSDERRRSGSHYTPRSLTEPIVRTTLRPVLESFNRDPTGSASAAVRPDAESSPDSLPVGSRLNGQRHPTPEDILNLKICDPAMGSGAFLVETCRQLGDELVRAWHVHNCAPKLPPDEDEVLHARRLIAQRCLYGVDKNPMAVDLAKLSLWLATLASVLQLYFDFAGYSSMAIGMGQMMGFRFPQNFNHPLSARSMRDFWRRWHITLSAWLRDYVYVPLGGSRKGEGRTIFNLFIVWFLSGFWHGADWNHILWGLWFFVFISLERTRFGPFIEARPRLGLLYAQFVFFLSLPLFSYSSLAESGRHFARMFSPVFHSDILYYLRGNGVLLLIAMVFCAPSVFRVIQSLFEKHAALRVVAMGALMLLSMAALVNEAYNPFIYFRF